MSTKNTNKADWSSMFVSAFTLTNLREVSGKYRFFSTSQNIINYLSKCPEKYIHRVIVNQGILETSASLNLLKKISLFQSTIEYFLRLRVHFTRLWYAQLRVLTS